MIEPVDFIVIGVFVLLLLGVVSFITDVYEDYKVYECYSNKLNIKSICLGWDVPIEALSCYEIIDKKYECPDYD